jgi:hypothetical protein
MKHMAFAAVCVCAVLIGIGAGVMPEEGLLECNITVEVEGTIIHYQQQSFWNESEFSAILANKEDFRTAVIKDFNEELSRYGERGEFAVGADVEFDETGKATILKCDVHDAITKSDGKYRATFKWLLTPLGLSFIKDNFEESEKGLSWEGTINGVSTSITLEFPASIGHCHGHVWWTMPAPSPSPVVTPEPSPSPAVSPTFTPSPSLTPTPPGFEAIFAITGITAVAYLVLRKRNIR